MKADETARGRAQVKATSPAQKKTTRPAARPPKAKRPRDVMTVIEIAERAGAEIRRHDVDSDVYIARTLGGIDRDEALAHVDARLGLLERQLELLLARRDEADQALEGQMEVLRASLQDSLRAAAEQVDEEKERRRVLQQQLAGLHKEAEARLARIVKRMQQRVDGELQAGREELALAQDTLATATERFSSQTEDLQKALAQKLDGSDSAWEAKLGRLAKSLIRRLEKLEGDAVKGAEAQESLTKAMDRFRAELKKQLESRYEALELRLEAGLEAAGRESTERVEMAFRELAVSLSATERNLEERLRGAEGRLRQIGDGMHDGLSAIGNQATVESHYIRTVMEQSKSRLEQGLARLSHVESAVEVLRAALDGLGPPSARTQPEVDPRAVAAMEERLRSLEAALEARSSADESAQTLISFEARLRAVEGHVAASVLPAVIDPAGGALEDRVRFLEAKFLEAELGGSSVTESSTGGPAQAPTALENRVRSLEAALDEILRTMSPARTSHRPESALEDIFETGAPSPPRPAWEHSESGSERTADILPGERRRFRR